MKSTKDERLEEMAHGLTLALGIIEGMTAAIFAHLEVDEIEEKTAEVLVKNKGYQKIKIILLKNR